MIHDLFERLADNDVPPVPVDFDQHVHDRVNHSLLGVHMMEFVFQVVPYAFLHLLGGLIGLVGVTLSGEFPNDRGDRQEAPP
ncbi:MAG: hypothetical protein HYX69_16300 [Planctomycetia bacterium]|nr:hypothetical protein [Planctomycetia bacterium]